MRVPLPPDPVTEPRLRAAEGQSHREGATLLGVSSLRGGLTPSGPGARDPDAPFFNAGMALNRDLSVLLVEAFARRKGREIDVADALAGTGARSARIAHEVAAPLIVHANDSDPRAREAQEAARMANGIPTDRMRIAQGDAHVFLASRRYDVVDLDPCGSPMPFLDAGVRATRHGGLLCVTATDTGALAGTFPRVARRRYDAHHGLHGEPWRSEVGLRILAGAVMRSAARFERVARPVLSVARGHWMRVVCQLAEGKGGTDGALRGLGFAVGTPTGGAFLRHPPADIPYAGPLWTGPLHDAVFVAGMREARRGKQMASPQVDALLEILADEAAVDAPFWLVPDRMQRAWGPPPRRDDLIARLRILGVPAARTHLDPQGVRSAADPDALRSAWTA